MHLQYYDETRSFTLQI